MAVLPTVAWPTVDLGACALASEARARVTVLLHCGVMPLQNPAVGQPTVLRVVFVIYKRRGEVKRQKSIYSGHRSNLD